MRYQVDGGIYEEIIRFCEVNAMPRSRRTQSHCFFSRTHKASGDLAEYGTIETQTSLEFNHCTERANA